jgi:hypothetical protein
MAGVRLRAMARETKMPPEMVALLKTIERLQADKARLAAKLAERDARIGELTPKRAAPVRLKTAALTLGIHYEAARRWCERGFVESARRQGGLWFCDIEDLRTIAIARMLPTDQKRSFS